MLDSTYFMLYPRYTELLPNSLYICKWIIHVMVFGIVSRTVIWYRANNYVNLVSVLLQRGLFFFFLMFIAGVSSLTLYL